MKYFHVLVSAFVLSLIIAVPSAWAKGQSPNVYVPRGESKAGNYYTAGNSVEVAGSVESDLIVVGGSVVVSGAVGGDVIVAGGKVRLSGPVGGNVRVLGGDVDIIGIVERNVMVAGGNVRLSESGQVKGQVTAAAGNLELRGKVGGSVLAAAGMVVLAGEVEGPVTVYLDSEGVLEVRESAVTGGAFTYYGTKQAQVAEGAQLHEAPQFHEFTPRTHSRGLWWWGKLFAIFSALVLGMVLVSLAPKKVQEAAEEALASPWRALGWGALWAVLVPVAVVILLITIIGLPLAVVLVALYVIGLLLASVVAGAAVGWYIKSRSAQSWFARQSLMLVVLSGIVIFRLFTFIPFVGGLVALV
ncbi:MAG: polymer-forming cytoskeletal protein, partial [Candidatus Veblenbacteria bacterium]|nr:polymer-forming cytoskeletal protein [Candidatus Veblenbacteria bacterium]